MCAFSPPPLSPGCDWACSVMMMMMMMMTMLLLMVVTMMMVMMAMMMMMAQISCSWYTHPPTSCCVRITSQLWREPWVGACTKDLQDYGPGHADRSPCKSIGAVALPAVVSCPLSQCYHLMLPYKSCLHRAMLQSLSNQPRPQVTRLHASSG